MVMRSLTIPVLFVSAVAVCTPLVAQEADSVDTPIVLGGIPLCGDPGVAKDFLSPTTKGDLKKFERQWRDREWQPNKILEIKISDPNIKLTLKGRQPSKLYIHIKDEKIHAVTARWRGKGTRGSFQDLYDELITKARAVLGEPDEVLENPRMNGLSGIEETERTFIWLEEDRETRVFDKRSEMKWYVAITVTCAATLKGIAGEENIF